VGQENCRIFDRRTTEDSTEGTKKLNCVTAENRIGQEAALDIPDI
jgi:hypothetical protein